MENTKFTKGKWELKDFTIRNPNRNTDKGNIFDIAQCWMGFNQTATREEAQANALLISKAPEMLEMMVDFVETCESEGVVNTDYYVNKFKKLIKEATEL